jgi:hypothetical protein
MSSRDTRPKKKSRLKISLEPISMEEILAGPGMSGFVSILDPREEVPHLQALVDDIKSSPQGGMQGRSLPRPVVPEAEGKAPETKAPGRNVIPLPRRDVPPVEEAEPPPALSPPPDIKKVPEAKRDTPPALAPNPEGSRYRVRRAVLAQDGHSSGEEVLYQSLWNCRYARQESKETRLVTIGWKAMSKLARLTPRNTRRNCETLIEKLAIEQLSGENSRESIGRTYRLFSYKLILERRRAAGMEWVTRSRGVVFVAAPVAGAGKEPLFDFSKRDAGSETVPDAEIAPGAKRDTGSTAPSPSLIVRTLREFLPDVDDASVASLVDACRQVKPDAADDEINYFVRIKADLMQRMGTVKSPMGFLRTAVPRCFEGESFRQFREAEAKRREAAQLREEAQQRELRRFQDEQRAILNNPQSSEEDRRFARNYLGIAEPD